MESVLTQYFYDGSVLLWCVSPDLFNNTEEEASELRDTDCVLSTVERGLFVRYGVFMGYVYTLLLLNHPPTNMHSLGLLVYEKLPHTITPPPAA